MQEVTEGRPRHRLLFTPTWDPAMEGWVVNHIKKHGWRCEPDYSFEDLMQEAHLLFLTLRGKYPEVVEAAHFMSLFKTSWNNHVHQLSLDRTRHRNLEGMQAEDADSDPLDFASGSDTDFMELELRLLLEDAPPPIAKMLRALAEERPKFEKVCGKRETTVEWLRRLAGVGQDVDICGMVRSFIGGGSCPIPS